MLGETSCLVVSNGDTATAKITSASTGRGTYPRARMVPVGECAHNRQRSGARLARCKPVVGRPYYLPNACSEDGAFGRR